MEDIIQKIKTFFGCNSDSVVDTTEGVKKKEIQYHPLTPIEDADCEVYFDALKSALSHKDVKNIAVTGPYGSGKSSMIRSFFAKYNQDGKYKPITITLANFEANVNAKLNSNEEKPKQKSHETTKETDPASPNKGLSEFELEQLIERSIVQQLFYHEKDETIPNSHFKKIHKESWEEIVVGTLYVLLILLSAIILISPSFFWSLPILEYTPKFVKELVSVFSLVLAFIGLWEIIKQVRTIWHQYSTMKFHVENAEIELKKNEGKSIFNHYIDEIIYFFEETGKNVVILEDLDRFNRHEIFTKLREINYLVNNCEKVNQKVVFIYALRDDMFTKSEERTKFFDFIIPIIPIVNYTNSGEILRQKLTVTKKSEIKDPSVEIEDELIDSLSLFIDDMRLLYNIINEYKIFTDIKSKDKLNASRLLTMIAYKNLYPQDFVELSQNKGLLYDVMEEVKPYKQKLIEQDEKKIAEAQAKIEQIETHDNSLLEKELRLVYLNQIIYHLSGTFVCFIINKERKTLYEVAEDDHLFLELISQTDLPYIHSVRANYNSSYYTESSTVLHDFKFKNIEHEVNPNLTYEQRVALLNKTELEKLKQEIRVLESSIETYKQSTIYELLTHGDFKVTNKKESRQFDFVLLALQNDYINENYWEYTSVFHEGSITNSDQTFILNVKLHRKTDYDYKLQQVENVFRKLTKDSERYLSYKESLNDDLMDYILQETMSVHSEPYVNTAKQNPDFVFHYIERGKNLNLFVDYLCQKWPLFIDYIVQNKSDELNKYLRIILENTLTENLIPFFKGKTIYLNNYADFMLLKIDEDKKHELIEELNLRFEKLNPETSFQDIIYIYRNFAYSINIDIIRTILSSTEKWDERAFNTRNYSYIKECYPEMAEYIQKNISVYITNVFLPLKQNSNISEEDFDELISSNMLTIKQKKQVITQCDVKINDISKIKPIELRGELCLQNKMTATWQNIKILVDDPALSLSQQCTEFVNILENAKQLSIQPLTEEMDRLANVDLSTISYTLIHFPKITDESYNLLLKAFTCAYSSFEANALTKERMRQLIDHNIVNADLAAYRFLKEYYDDLHIYLLQKFSEQFTEDFSELELDTHDISLLLQVQMDVKNKVKILNGINLEILNGAVEITQQLGEWLIENYAEAIETIDKTIIETLCKNVMLPLELRIPLYTKYASIIEEDDAIIESFKEPYSSILNKAIRARISHTDENRALLDILKSKKIIANYADMKKYNYYRVYHKA